MLAALAILGSVAAQLVLLHREEYMLWFVPVLFGVCTLAVGLLAVRRSLAAPAMALAFVVLLIAPTAYAAPPGWRRSRARSPPRGPKTATGAGGSRWAPTIIGIDRALTAYVGAHHPGRRWALLTVASETAAPLILLDFDAGAVGATAAPTRPSTARAGGAGRARRSPLRAAWRRVLAAWRQPRDARRSATRARRLNHPSGTARSPTPIGVTLFDCAGRERQLEAEPRS